MRAPVEYPVNELIAERWSPYCFSDRPVSDDDLRSVFEAVRWAPSCYNEQPWNYLIAKKEDAAEYARLLSCLVEGNQAWAKNAPVLAIGIVRLDFTHNGKPNHTALHDLGLAAGNLLAEATARGLCVHQMGGILPDRVSEEYGVPEGFEPLTGIAIGYEGSVAACDAEMAQRDAARRPRKSVKEFLFSGTWGNASDIASR
jgi:nitroreductase